MFEIKDFQMLHDNQMNSFEIIDAKNSSFTPLEVQIAIDNISNRELQDEDSSEPVSYVKKKYFKSLPLEAGLGCPEIILLAIQTDKIIGFIITAKKKEVDPKDRRLKYSSEYIPYNTGFIAYLAVDSSAKRLGVGSKLMLEAMKKTKELGKQYIKLEYLEKGQGLDPVRSEARTNFYNSFPSRFGIPIAKINKVMVSRQIHTTLKYDLKEIDFEKIIRLNTPTDKSSSILNS